MAAVLYAVQCGLLVGRQCLLTISACGVRFKAPNLVISVTAFAFLMCHPAGCSERRAIHPGGQLSEFNMPLLQYADTHLHADE